MVGFSLSAEAVDEVSAADATWEALLGASLKVVVLAGGGFVEVEVEVEVFASFVDEALVVETSSVEASLAVASVEEISVVDGLGGGIMVILRVCVVVAVTVTSNGVVQSLTVNLRRLVVEDVGLFAGGCVGIELGLLVSLSQRALTKFPCCA